MKETSLKSGSDIVKDFVESILELRDVDRKSAKAIRELYEAGTLNKNRLLKSLNEIRKGPENGQTEETTN